MPNMKWSCLSHLQLGRYAEYYAKMEFASYGFDVYTSEVDDHGIDFIVKAPNSLDFFEIQVKSVKDYNYAFIPKDKMVDRVSKEELPHNRIVCYLRFEEDRLPCVYVIPASAWKTPNAVLTSKDYDGLKSKPEWGINVSRKNLHLLEPFKAETALSTLASETIG